jgi:hypothetical protein
MKKLIIPILLLLLFAGCNKYEVSQTFEYTNQYKWNKKVRHIRVETNAYLGGSCIPVWSSYDVVHPSMSDSVACARYKEAEEAIVVLKRLRKNKCD